MRLFDASVTDQASATFVTVNASANSLFGTVSEQNEETQGAYAHCNVDNDNYTVNTTADKDEGGPVAGENDLVALQVGVSPLPDIGTVALNTQAAFQVWKNPAKGAANLIVGPGAEKTWDLTNSTQRSDFIAVCGSLFTEGVQDNTSGNLALEYRLTSTLDDKIKYNLVAATCGDQPTPAQRVDLGGAFPGLIHCEWSITAPADDVYNCIAWSVGETNTWYNANRIDIQYGDNDGVFETSDMDRFYKAKSGLLPNASGAKDAQVMYYPLPSDWAYGVDPMPTPGYHGAARKGCTCMHVDDTVFVPGKYMFESKCGQAERIEHVWNHLNGSSYGSPSRFYK